MIKEEIEKTKKSISDEIALDIVGDFLLIPDTFFIFKLFEVEMGIANKKILNVAFQQIIEQAPLPIEQLLWGIVPVKESSGKWLWYAGLKDRIQSFIGDEKHKHLLPYGALGVLLSKEKECCAFVARDYVSVIIDKYPTHLLPKGSDDFLSLQDKLSEEQKKFPLRYVYLDSIEGVNSYNYTLNVVSEVLQRDKEKQKIDLLESYFWLADIRDKEELVRMKSQQTWSRISNVGIKWGGIIFSCLLTLQLFLGIGFSIFHGKERKYRRLQPIAKKVENKDLLIGQMQTIMSQEMRPFELLGLLNKLRPPTIYFTSAAIDNIHNIVVEAVAENAIDVDTYVRALKESDQFLEVNIDNINASYQGTKFKLSCDFKEQKDFGMSKEIKS